MNPTSFGVEGEGTVNDDTAAAWAACSDNVDVLFMLLCCFMS